LLIIGLYGIGAHFLEFNFPKRIQIGTLLLPEISMKNNVLEALDNQTNCSLYSIQEDPSVTLLICHYYVPMWRSSAWCNEIFQHIKTERVVVLDRLSNTKYSFEDEIIAPFLRKVVTTEHRRKYKSDVDTIAKYLEAPDMIENAAAAIISHCERNQIDASLFLSFQDVNLLEPESLEAFESILPHFGVTTQIPQQINKYKELTQRIAKSNSLFI